MWNYKTTSSTKTSLGALQYRCSSIEACRPWIFFINGVLCFLNLHLPSSTTFVLIKRRKKNESVCEWERERVCVCLENIWRWGWFGFCIFTTSLKKWQQKLHQVFREKKTQKDGRRRTLGFIKPLEVFLCTSIWDWCGGNMF